MAKFYKILIFATVASASVIFLSLGKPTAVALIGDPAVAPTVYSEGGLSAIPDYVIKNPAKAELGYRLFRDTRFSKNNTLSCNSCHDLSTYGSDHRAFSLGTNGQLGEANSPTVFNSSLNFRQFWDGRADSLLEQINGPIQNPKELATSWSEILSKINSDPEYVKIFKSIYNQSPNQENITDSIIYFENALITPNAPLDKYLRGDRNALSTQQLSGLKKFRSYGCIACHQGENVGGNMFQTLGVMGNYFADRGGSFPSDVGRFAVTKKDTDFHVFRVPSLRNVAQTAPYFHDGQVKTLERAVALMGKYQLGRDLTEDDISDLVAFLNSLTGERPAVLNSERNVANAKETH